MAAPQSPPMPIATLPNPDAASVPAVPPTAGAPTLAPPEPGPDAAPLVAPGETGDGPATTAPKWKRRNKKKGRRLLKVVIAIVLIAGLAAASALAFQEFAGEGTGDDSTPADEPVAAPGLAGGEPGALFDDTQQLVDDINTNPAVDEALAALGLDETGGALPGEAGVDTAPIVVASYGFRWSDPLGLTVSVQVDSETGNFVATANDGTEIRHVGGRYFGLASNSTWVELSPDVVSGIPVVGIDGLLDDLAIVPDGLEQFIVATEVTADGTVRLLVDDSALAANNPELRDRWLGPWGLLDSSTPEATTMPEGVPAQASAGQVVVSVAHTTEGLVSEVVVSSPAIGGAATYSLSSTAIYALPVDVPAELAGG